MGRRREVGVGQPVAGQPVARLDQVADVAQMIAQIGARRSHRLHVRAAAAVLGAHEALVDLFPDEPLARFVEELDVEPVHQPARLGAPGRIVGQKPTVAEAEPARLVEIFGDDLGARQDGAIVLDHHRRRAFRRHQQKFAPPLPGPLLDQLRLDSHFAEREADEARMRAKGVMVKRDHDDAGDGGFERPRHGAPLVAVSNALRRVNPRLTAAAARGQG